MTDMSVKQMEAQASKKVKGAKVSKTPAIWVTLSRARRMFHQQLKATQNNSTKIACIHEASNEVYKKDSYMVWYDLVNESRRLTNLIDFNKYCGTLNLAPATVAQHVVFDGSSIVNKVIRYGVESVLGERILAYNEPLFNPVKIEELRYGPEFTTVRTEEEPKPQREEASIALVEEPAKEEQPEAAVILDDTLDAEMQVATASETAA